MILTMELPEQVSQTTYCFARMTELFAVISGDDYFYEFVGRTAGIMMEDVLHPSCREEFQEACSKVKPQEPVRLVTFFKDAAGDYQMVDVILAEHGEHSNGEKLYDLTIYNISSIENKYMHCVDNVKRYRNYLAMYNGYLFDYDVEADCLSVFSYYTVKATVFIRETLEGFYQKMRASYQDERAIADLKHFCDRLKKAETNFSMDVRGGKPDYTGIVGMFQIEANVIYKTDRGKLVVGVIRFLDEEIQDNVPVYALPEGKDSFTGLINKCACQEYVKDAIAAENCRHYMAIVDVDNFKVVNDTCGHLYGDKVILEIASILNSALNGRGVVSHFGGDEFLIFTDWIETEMQMRSLLTYIRQRVRETFDNWEKSCKITLSIGVCSAPDDGTDYYELFEKADKCLYLAKNKGRNRYIIYDEKKHGKISVSGNAVAEIADPVERAEQLATVVAETGILLLTGGKSVIPAALEEICRKFQIDGIRVYDKSAGTPVYSAGSYRNEIDLDSYVTEDRILPYFVHRNYMAYTNFVNFQIYDKKLYEMMASEGIRGTVCCYMTGKDGQNRYFFFDAIDRKIIWTESDKNYFLLLSRLLAEVME